MKFIKATICSSNDLYEGKTEFFALDKILNIAPHTKSGTAKLLLGAGLYWDVYTDSMEIVTLNDTESLNVIKGARQ